MGGKKSMGTRKQFLYAPIFRQVILFFALIGWIAGCKSQSDIVTPRSCSFTVSPVTTNYTALGGTGSVSITTQADCSWTAQSDADWVAVIYNNSGTGSNTITYRVAVNQSDSERATSIDVVDEENINTNVLHQVTQSATGLRIRGTYTFMLEVDPDEVCEWPVTKFYWPVSIKDISIVQGTQLASIVFPSASINSSNKWSISAGPTQTVLIPIPDSPGPAGGEYDVVVDGGHWEAGALTRARDGRGEITSGTTSGVKQILTLRDSGEQWECKSDVKWSLLIRFVDRD